MNGVGKKKSATKGKEGSARSYQVTTTHKTTHTVTEGEDYNEVCRQHSKVTSGENNKSKSSKIGRKGVEKRSSNAYGAGIFALKSFTCEVLLLMNL